MAHQTSLVGSVGNGGRFRIVIQHGSVNIECGCRKLVLGSSLGHTILIAHFDRRDTVVGHAMDIVVLKIRRARKQHDLIRGLR
jgi:hypothetical protein